MLRRERSREQSRGVRPRHESRERRVASERKTSGERERHAIATERGREHTRECNVAGCGSYIEAIE